MCNWLYNVCMNYYRGIIAVVLLCIFSGLYIFTKLAPKEIPLPVIPKTIDIPFNGKVPTEITHGDTTKKQIIFTFDGGEGIQSATAILDILKKHHAKASFFLTGKWVLNNKSIVQRMLAEGHEVFNHTYDHPHLTELDDKQITDELITVDNVVVNLTGTSTRPYFRPPYGDRDAHVLAVAAKAGFRSVYWTVDAHDWMQSTGTTAEQVRERILANISSGTIILMHVGDTITGAILDDVFTTLEGKGYKIVSLTQGL